MAGLKPEKISTSVSLPAFPELLLAVEELPWLDWT